MAPVRRDDLAAACREADPQAVTDFVAGLYDARGYTVDRPGERQVRLSPSDRTVAVCPPETASLDAVDAVVKTDPDRTVGGDVEVIGPERIHEQLRYAVDRPVARDLLATHLGVAPDATGNAAGDGPRERVDGVETAGPGNDGWTLPSVPAFEREWIARRRPVLLIAIAGLVVFAGFALGGTLDPGDNTASAGPTTATETPRSAETPTPGEATPRITPTSATQTEPLDTVAEQEATHPYPRGLDSRGLADVDALVAAHRSELTTTSYTLTVRYRESVDGQTTGVYTETIRVENATRYSVSVSTVGDLRTTPRGIIGTDFFAGDGGRYVRVESNEPYVLRRATPSRFLGQTARYLRWSLSVEDSTLRDRRTVSNVSVYRVTTDGDTYQGIQNASGTVYVTEDSLIPYGRWSYGVPERPELDVEFSLQTSDVGSTTVSRPAWVDEKTASTPTAEQSGSE